MKFFNWMQSKVLHSGQGGHKNSNTTTPPPASQNMKQQQAAEPAPIKEEFIIDWPHHGLLTIGTFGNNDLPTENIGGIQNNNITASSSPDLSEFTPEEIGKLQKELTKLLSKKPAAATKKLQAEEITSADHHQLPLDRFLNCPSSLEVDRRLSTTLITNPDPDKEEIDRTIKVILGRCKDICVDSNKKAIIGRKRSISFLLKKMFVCSSGLPPMPGVHDRLPESRMERLLRAMLKNKIGPQNSSRASSSARKLIENRQSAKKGKGTATTENDDDEDGSKWVKTDSEYIVLEI